MACDHINKIYIAKLVGKVPFVTLIDIAFAAPLDDESPDGIIFGLKTIKNIIGDALE